MLDAPAEKPRDGGSLETAASSTGRKPASHLPKIKTLPGAYIRVVATSGAPLRGTRSDADSNVPETALVDVVPGTKVIVTAFDDQQSQSSVVSTI